MSKKKDKEKRKPKKNDKKKKRKKVKAEIALPKPVFSDFPVHPIDVPRCRHELVLPEPETEQEETTPVERLSELAFKKSIQNLHGVMWDISRIDIKAVIHELDILKADPNFRDFDKTSSARANADEIRLMAAALQEFKPIADRLAAKLHTAMKKKLETA